MEETTAIQLLSIRRDMRNIIQAERYKCSPSHLGKEWEPWSNQKGTRGIWYCTIFYSCESGFSEINVANQVLQDGQNGDGHGVFSRHPNWERWYHQTRLWTTQAQVSQEITQILGGLRFDILRKRSAAGKIKHKKRPRQELQHGRHSLLAYIQTREWAATTNYIFVYPGLWMKTRWPRSYTGTFNIPHHLGLSSKAMMTTYSKKSNAILLSETVMGNLSRTSTSQMTGGRWEVGSVGRTRNII